MPTGAKINTNDSWYEYRLLVLGELERLEQDLKSTDLRVENIMGVTTKAIQNLRMRLTTTANATRQEIVTSIAALKDETDAKIEEVDDKAVAVAHELSVLKAKAAAWGAAAGVASAILVYLINFAIKIYVK